MAAILLVFIGAAFGGISFYAFHNVDNLKLRGGHTSAVVSDLVWERSSSSEAGVCYPVFQFVTDAGQRIELKGKAGANPPQYKKGDSVNVLYEHAHPENFTVNSWEGLYLLPTIFGILSCLLTILGVGLVTVRWKRSFGQKSDITT